MLNIYCKYSTINYVRAYSELEGVNIITGSDSENLINPNWSDIATYYKDLIFFLKEN